MDQKDSKPNRALPDLADQAGRQLTSQTDSLQSLNASDDSIPSSSANSTETPGMAERRQNRDEAEEKSKSKLKLGLIIAGATLAVIVASIAIYFAFFFNSMSTQIQLDEIEVQDLAAKLVPVENKEDPFYMLILGSDSRDITDSGAGRSDTIMLIRVDPTVPQLTVISVPRDLEVYIDGYGYNKINHAFRYEGPAGAVQAVSTLAGVPISHYAEIDFPGLIDLVDELGGIEVNVPQDISYKDGFIAAGRQLLNGEQALLMSRSRNFPEGDLIRVQNQRLVLQAIIKSVLSLDVTALPGMLEKLAGNVGTTLQPAEILELVMAFRGMDSDALLTGSVPTFYNDHDGGAYLGLVEDEWAAMMERVKQGLPPTG